MAAEVLECLKELGIPSELDVVRAGLQSDKFREIIVHLANEIHVLGETEEKLSNGSDLNVLGIELSSLLMELRCPYESLMTGSQSDRFNGERNAVLLLNYLTTELLSLQMYHSNKTAAGESNVIHLQETPTATALKGLCTAMTMGPPPANLTTTDLFVRLNARLDETLKRVGRSRIGKPLLSPNKSWTAKQWMDLEKRHAELDKEYDLRRTMLLTRLDCTVQAFNWSERMKSKQNEILEKYRKKLNVLEKLVKGGENTDVVALLAARDLLLAIEKASSAAVVKNTKSKIQRHIIGSVPDRGGRAWEHAPPPPEMPSWQKQRSTGGGGGGGGRGGGGGFRGNNQNHQNRNNNQQRNHHNQQHHQNDQGNYDTSRGRGRRVQSGWSQRGAGGGGGGQYHGQDDYHGGRGGGRGGHHHRGRGGRY